MKRLVISVLAIAFLAVHCTGFLHNHKKRDADGDGANADKPDTGVIAGFVGILDTVEGVPLIGSGVHFGRTWTYDTFNAVEDMTNGGIARMMGGALPCVISIENGLQCTGITEENNVAKLIMQLVDQGPFPEILKGIMDSGLKMSVNPVSNMVFGGVTVPT